MGHWKAANESKVLIDSGCLTLHISKIKARKNATDSIELNSACFELFRLIEVTWYNNAVNRMLEKLTDYQIKI